MSAFMVDKVHIDLLVQTALHGPRNGNEGHYPIRDSDPLRWHWSGNSRAAHVENALEIGTMLIRENLRSIHARYPDTVGNPDGTPGPIVRYWEQPYTYATPGYRLTTVEAFAAITCYEYQSCESEEWEQSEAAAFCKAFRHRLIGNLPGYHDAPWEWTPELVQAARTGRLLRR